MSQLKSPYIVELFESFTEDDIQYMVLEYCNKGDLYKSIETYSSNHRNYTESVKFSTKVDISALVLSTIARSVRNTQKEYHTQRLEA